MGSMPRWLKPPQLVQSVFLKSTYWYVNYQGNILWVNNCRIYYKQTGL
jgi:hypothetical protein